MTMIRRLTLDEIRDLDEGQVVGFRVGDNIVQAKVLSAPRVTMHRLKSGRWDRAYFYVALEYVDPRTRTTRACHVTQGLRDLLVTGK